MLMEKVVYDHLKASLPCPVVLDAAGIKADTYVVIERVGGSEDEVKRGSFAIQSYGKSLLEACTLNEEVKTAMKGLTAFDDVSDVSLDSDYNYTDQDIKRYRYQAIFDVFFF